MEFEFKKIKSIGKVKVGTTAPQEAMYFSDGKYPFLRASDLGAVKKSMNFTEIKDHLNDLAVKEKSLNIAKAGSVIFPKSGASVLTNNCAILGIDTYFVNHLAAIEVDESQIPKEWLYFYLNSIDFAILVDDPSYPSLKQSKIENIKIPVPKNIDLVKFTSDLKIKIIKIEEMRQSALKQKEAVEALQGALLRAVFPYKEGDELPKGWKWEKVDNLAKVGKTRKKKVATSIKELTSFVPMDSVDDISGKITKTLYRPYDELGQSYTYFENGDIIFAKITPCMQNGKCAIVSEMKDGFGYGSSEYIVLTPTKPIYTKWVHYFLRTVELRRAAEEHFTGSAGQQRVPTDYLQKYPIPVPEDESAIEELTNKLDNKHEEYFNLIKKTETQLEAIEALPAAILREVFEFKNN
jgi:restriction endonuclease S subunit